MVEGLSAVTTFVPPVTASDVLQQHEVLRVTFTAAPPFWISRDTAQANLATDVGRLVAAMEEGGFAVVPVSDPSVPLGADAVTVDFMVPGPSHASLGAILAQMGAALFGPVELVHSTAISRVERLQAPSLPELTEWYHTQGETTETEAATAQAEHPGLLSLVGSIGAWAPWAVGLGVLVLFAPEVKALMHSTAQRRATT